MTPARCMSTAHRCPMAKAATAQRRTQLLARNYCGHQLQKQVPARQRIQVRGRVAPSPYSAWGAVRLTCRLMSHQLDSHHPWMPLTRYQQTKLLELVLKCTSHAVPSRAKHTELVCCPSSFYQLRHCSALGPASWSLYQDPPPLKVWTKFMLFDKLLGAAWAPLQHLSGLGLVGPRMGISVDSGKLR